MHLFFIHMCFPEFIIKLLNSSLLKRKVNQIYFLIIVQKPAVTFTVAKEKNSHLCLCLSVHTLTVTPTHTKVLMYKLSAVSFYRNAWFMSRIYLFWLRAISLLWNILILSNKHMFWIGAWELNSFWQIFHHPALEWKKSLGESRTLIFSLLPCCLFLEPQQHTSRACAFPWRPCLSICSKTTVMANVAWTPRPHPTYWRLVNLYGDSSA